MLSLEPEVDNSFEGFATHAYLLLVLSIVLVAVSFARVFKVSIKLRHTYVKWIRFVIVYTFDPIIMSIISVNCENIKANPHCPHGPTLKFSRLVKGKIKTFFACSACRDRKDCPFFLWEDEKVTNAKQLALEEWKKSNFPEIRRNIINERMNLFKKQNSKKHFCMTCFDFVFPLELNKHKNHILNHITNDQLDYPSKLLNPVTGNKSQAQYFFSKKSLDFFEKNILPSKSSKVLCIGTPTLFEVLKIRNIECLLLDIDHRYHWFYNKNEFLWFNMFNFHFLVDGDECFNELKKFLQDASALVVIDPPFGARLEPLQKTLHELQLFSDSELKIMLILPYFMEPNVLKSFPDFHMLDFPVDYTNHRKFRAKSTTSVNSSSPVRIFTNISCSLFEFPSNEGYHFCKKCDAWRSKYNVHCDLCDVCPSKNGHSYKHCADCNKCVKPTWTHCISCGFCCLPDHVCKTSSPKIKNDRNRKKNKCHS